MGSKRRERWTQRDPPGVTDPASHGGWEALIRYSDANIVALCGDATVANVEYLKVVKAIGVSIPAVPLPGTVAAWDAAMREHWKFGTTPFAHFSFNSKTIAIKSN